MLGDFHMSFRQHMVRGSGLATAKVAISPGRQGGDISIERLVPEMVKLHWKFNFVTSLVDFYGFQRKQDGETVERLEAQIN